MVDSEQSQDTNSDKVRAKNQFPLPAGREGPGTSASPDIVEAVNHLLRIGAVPVRKEKTKSPPITRKRRRR